MLTPQVKKLSVRVDRMQSLKVIHDDDKLTCENVRLKLLEIFVVIFIEFVVGFLNGVSSLPSSSQIINNRVKEQKRADGQKADQTGQSSVAGVVVRTFVALI